MSHEKKKILIVEDSKFTTELIKGALGKAQYEIEACAAGPQGLERSRTWHPDLVILDIVMPGMDGFEVCRQLKQDPLTKLIPVMLLTVKDTVEDLQRGFQVKADYFMTKPFTEALLLNNVHKIFSEQGSGPKEGEAS